MKIDNIIPSVVIKKILFNDGNRFKFKSDDIVLLVGANNVGKSRTLKDLKDDLDCKSESKVLVKEISYKKMGFSESQLRDYFDRNYIKSSNGGYEVIIEENDCRHFADYVFVNIGNGEIFFSALFSFLSTEDRLSLTRPIQLSILPDTKNLYIYQKLEKSYSYITKLNDALDSGFQNAIEVFEDNENGRITKKYKIGRTEDILKAIEYDSRKKLRS